MILKTLFSASLLVTVGMLTGRLLGLLREILLASEFGAHTQADTAILLLMVPDFITSALIGSAASAAFIPAFTARGPEEALALLWQGLIISVAAFTVAGVLAAAIIPFVNMFSSAPLAFVVTLCSLPLSAATAIITAYLQFRTRFLIPAFANAIFNGVIILTLWARPATLTVFAIDIAGAALIRLFAHVLALNHTSRSRHNIDWSMRQMDKPLLKAYGAATGAGILGLLPFYAPYAAIAFTGGSIALFNYAFKLILLPSIIVQMVVQMVLLPWFAALRHAEEVSTLHTVYSMTLRIAWITGWVVSLTLAWVSTPLAFLCFGYGKMTADDVLQVSSLFSIGVWAVVPGVMGSVWQQLLYANGCVSAVLRVSMYQALLVVPLSWLGYAEAGVTGVTIAYVISMVFPLFLFANAGVRHDIIRHMRPSWSYVYMTLVSTTIFLPLAWIVRTLALPKIGDISVTGIIGLISLMAGLLVCHPVRVWVRQQVARL